MRRLAPTIRWQLRYQLRGLGLIHIKELPIEQHRLRRIRRWM